MYNMMTCEGFGNSFFGGCTLAWFGFALIVFLAMIARRQCADGVLSGTPFNVIGAMVLGIGAYVIVITLSGAAKWAFLAGILGVALGGWLIGLFANQAEDNE